MVPTWCSDSASIANGISIGSAVFAQITTDGDFGDFFASCIFSEPRAAHFKRAF